jgi:hypothetical protein
MIAAQRPAELRQALLSGALLPLIGLLLTSLGLTNMAHAFGAKGAEIMSCFRQVLFIWCGLSPRLKPSAA